MTFKRKDLAVQVNIKTIKGYTMREIGALEERIKRLEYYTVLNALELDTKTLSVRDAQTNIERFKNGIFADPFNDHTLGKTEDREYRIAVSSSKSIARPSFSQLFHNFKLQPSLSSNVKTAGRLCMIDYDSEVLGGNPFATTYRNCTESFYKFNGTIQLFPNFDNVNQVTQAAPQNVTIDLAGAFADLVGTGVFQNIDTVVGENTLIGSSSQAMENGGTAVTNQWSQTTTKTVTDIAVNVSPINVDLGSYVKDVSTLPYMRSRLISVVARGLKPNTRLYAYFDRVPVTNECAPAVVSAAYATAGGKIDQTRIGGLVGGRENEILTAVAPRGTPIYSNAEGEAYLVFLLPQNTFRGGDRTFVLTNVDDLKAVSAVITTAEGTYTSSALAVTTQNLSFSILQPSFTPTTVVTSSTVNTTEYYEIPPPPPDPVAQTFVINETADVRVPGVYLTQIGVYFKKKSASLGVSCVVAATTVGIPDSKKILGSIHLDSADVSVSEDSSLETVFRFDTPILLQSDQTYAFWLAPDGSNPDYEMWISEVGGTDLLTSRAITQQPYSGIMYVSSNGKSWTPVQSSDIKFKLYRARFKALSATATFSNENDDFLTLSTIDRSDTGTPISIGDVVYAANSANTNQTLTSPTTHPFGVVYAIDELNGLMYVERSNGKFNASTYPVLKIYRVPEIGNTQQVTANNLVATANLVSIDDPAYHGVVPKFNLIEPIGTSVKMTFLGTSNAQFSYVKDGQATSVKNEDLFLYNDYERTLRSYSNEVASGAYGTAGSATFTVTMRTENPYVSPVIDLGVKTFSFLKNEINFDFTDENTRYGNALNKYISKNVVLNQEAEDLIVYVTGYRPNGTDIKVYGKFLNANDTESFDSKDWTLLVNQQNSIYGSPQDLEDYREYVFTVPTADGTTYDQNDKAAFLDTNPPAGEVLEILSYYDGFTRKHSGFSIFSLKILLLSNNPVVIPTMRDVRAIALQK